MKHHFTIVELLVSTAIVTVLAGILFPVWGAQPKSIAACLANENQLITGLRAYATDYNDHVLPYSTCAAYQCPGITSDVQRVWTSRLKPYISSPLDPDTGDPYFPPTTPYRCPDWNLTRLEQAADAADCDGDGTAGSGLPAPYLPYAIGKHMRSELFSTYGLAFGMCSPPETFSGDPLCLNNGGANPDATTYGRDGSSANLAIFAYAGDALYPPQYKHYLGRTLAETVRPSEQAMFADGGTWAYPSSPNNRILELMGCEAAHMHWQHIWGGNIAFEDGHAAWIGGNPESYRYVGPDGLWIEKYFTFYE